VTIVANKGADAFIKRLPRDMRFYLVHGNDEGLIHERTRGIVKSVLEGDSDPLRLTRFDGDALAREPGRLADEAYAISMFGGHRAIWIEAQARDLMAVLEPLLADPPRDSTVVIEAGSLKKGTALRSAFEKMANGASIECYADDRATLGGLIDMEAREAGLRIAPDVRDMLVELVGSDRMTTRGEIAKLMLYRRGQESIRAEDVEAIVSDAAPSTLDEAVDSAFLGDHAGIEATASRYFSSGGDASLLMMRVVSRLMLLHRIRLEMEEGRGLENVLQALYVRLPPSARGALVKQAERWSSAALARRFAAIQTVASRVRSEPKMAEIAAVRALWALASGVRAGRS